MQATDRFSVVIPVYNKAQVLARAVESALAQTGVEMEILCVDDGSVDGSRDRLAAWGGRISVIAQDNRGPSAARNRGVAAATMPWVAFLDADDAWEPGYLAAVAELRRRHPRVGYTLASYRLLEGPRATVVELGRRDLPWAPGDPPRATTRASAQLTAGMASGAVACSADLFRAVGGFDEDLPRWEIADLVFKLLCAHGEAGIIEAPAVTIHRDPANSQGRREEGNVRAHARLARNHIAAAAEVTRPEGAELRAAASRLALRSARGLLRAGLRREARQLLALLPAESPRLERAVTAVGCWLPAAVVRRVAPGKS
jgi:glycosyltransferase involved in cell wall biosynthesis